MGRFLKHSEPSQRRSSLPLSGHTTLQNKHIKIGAEVVRWSLPSSWPRSKALFAEILGRIDGLRPAHLPS